MGEDKSFKKVKIGEVFKSKLVYFKNFIKPPRNSSEFLEKIKPETDNFANSPTTNDTATIKFYKAIDLVTKPMVDRTLLNQGKILPCKKGCSYCCKHDAIFATADEITLIINYIRNMEDNIKNKKLKSNNSKLKSPIKKF